MIQKEHDGIVYDYFFERGQQWVGPDGTMRWIAVFQVRNSGGVVCWLHELTGEGELPFLDDMELMI